MRSFQDPRESSVEELIRASWSELAERWRATGTTFHLLIEACARLPNLSKLRPYTSMNRLLFSRCTDAPFKALPLGACTTEDPGLFIAYLDIFNRVDQGRSQPLTALECAQLLENSLPANLGWARLGRGDEA